MFKGQISIVVCNLVDIPQKTSGSGDLGGKMS